MDASHNLLSLFLHLDEHLRTFTQSHGTGTYLILFLILFAETGFVVTPFLPGDSLLFAAGAISALEGGGLNVGALLVLFLAAAVLGDTVNYHIGHFFGARLFAREHSRIFNRKHLERTELFFEKYGGKTIVIARFVPIVRTFAPFVAGMGSMSYRHFLFYNVAGAALWVAVGVLGGYFFGNLGFVKHNFSLVILGIVALSLLPPLFEWWNHRRAARAPAVVSDAAPEKPR